MKKLVILAVVCFSIIITSRAMGQDSLGISRVDQALDYWVASTSAASSGDSIFVATPSGLRIVEYTNGQFEQVALIEELQPTSLEVVGGSLRMLSYKSSRYEIAVCSLDQPAEVLGSLNFANELQHKFEHGWVNNDSLSCLILGNDENAWHLNTIDFRDPENLRIVAVIDTFHQPNALALDGNRLFVVTNFLNLTIIDLTDPEQPELLANHRLDWGVNNLQVDDTLAVFAGFRENGIVTMDISDLENLEVLGQYRTEDRESPNHLIWDGDRLFYDEPFSSQPQVIKLLSLEDLTQPRLTWQSRTFWSIDHPLLIADNLVVPLSGSVLAGISMFSLDNRFTPQYQGSTISDGFPGKLILTDHRLYVLEGPPLATDIFPYPQDTIIYPNIQILGREAGEINAVGKIRLTDVDVPNYRHSSADLAERNDTVFVAFGCCRIYDARDPARPRLLSEMYPEGEEFEYGEGYSFTGLKANVLFLASVHNLQALDVRNVRDPQLLGTVTIEGEFDLQDLTIVDDRAFLHTINGYVLCDISDPSDMAVIETIVLAENERPYIDLVFHRDRLYGRFGDEMEPNDLFSIFNIADPADPQILGSVNVGVEGFGFSVDGEYAALTLNNVNIDNPLSNSLLVLNVADPENIRPIGHYNTFRNVYRPILEGRSIYLSEGCRVASYDISAALGEEVPPLFRDPPDNINVSETQLIRFNLQAADLNGDSLELTAFNLPEGSSFTDEGGGNGTFNWQTDFTSAGEYAADFVVSDGELTDTAVVRIVVNNVNRPPFLNHTGQLEPQDSSALSEIDITRFLWSSASDPDNDRIIYTLLLEGYRDHFYFNAGSDTLREVRRGDLLSLMGDSLQAIHWRVMATDGFDTVFTESSFTLMPPLSVPNDPLQPASFSLSAFPNPFNSSVTISFTVGAQGLAPLRLAIYDINGRLVADLFSGKFIPPTPPAIAGGASQTVIWEASSVGAGVFFVRLQAGKEVKTEKIVFVQ